jgi:hypothetical protein
VLVTRLANAIKLDAAEAPWRQADQRKHEAAEASATRDKARVTNKAAFRPSRIVALSTLPRLTCP